MYLHRADPQILVFEETAPVAKVSVKRGSRI